ncbi:MAG: Rossmann-like and DUF2520 domain-containing protein [Flavobacteriaceae bacterium]
MMQLTLLGNGRVASFFKQLIEKSTALEWVGWYAREFRDETLPKGVQKVSQIEDLPPADLHLVCVSDDALPIIVPKIQQKGIVAHTSGAVGLEVFQKQQTAGVFYPLQSFSKESLPKLADIPICIEADTAMTFSRLEAFAQIIGLKSQAMYSQQRLQLHLAAVFANNFSNHCWTIAKELCEKSNISFDLLQPLIENSFRKMQQIGPKAAQTGPALRKDQQTIEKHLNHLNPDLGELYQKLSDSIQNAHEL